MRLVTDENLPAVMIAALRAAGNDVVLARSLGRGVKDATLLKRVVRDRRILVTLDKDFGEIAMRTSMSAESGIVLIRMVGVGPDLMAVIITRALGERRDWGSHFSVIDSRRVRMRSLLRPRNPTKRRHPSA